MRMKDGFTLVELLAVMIVLGLLVVLVIPAYSSIYSGIKRNTYQNKLVEISTAAKKYGSKIKDEIKSYYDTHDECYKIEPRVLIEKGYMMSDFESKPAFKNPADQTEMDGDIRICYCKTNFDIEAYYVEKLEINDEDRIVKPYYEDDILMYNKVLYKCIESYGPTERSHNDKESLNRTKKVEMTSEDGKKSIKVGGKTYFVQVEC